jgi:hypothetical protein
MQAERRPGIIRLSSLPQPHVRPESLHEPADHAQTVQPPLAAEPDLTIAELRARRGTEKVRMSSSVIPRSLVPLGRLEERKPGVPRRKSVHP